MAESGSQRNVSREGSVSVNLCGRARVTVAFSCRMRDSTTEGAPVLTVKLQWIECVSGRREEG